MKPSRVHIVTFGCQMNRLDSELIADNLRASGFGRARGVEDADVILFNTCSVRQHAEERVYSRLGALQALKRKRPEVVVGVIGCMAQMHGEAVFERAPHVTLVCGTKGLSRLAEFIADVQKGMRVCATEKDGAPLVRRSASERLSKHFAYVYIMRGCDNYCAYCVVPYARGPEESRPPAEIVAEVRALADDGCKEVTLLGQNVNSYGKGLAPKVGLADLLERLDAVPGLERIRFVTSHPKDMLREILRAVGRLKKVCEHLHMPAQSGADAVLKAMNRRYTSARYREIVAEARELIPGVAVASDFIVGFPAETAEDFEATERLMRDVRFQQSFVFKYSPRPRTAAAQRSDDVPQRVKAERNRRLLAVQEEISREEHAKLHGKDVEVLVEGPSKSDSSRLTGRARTNHIVIFPGPKSLAGRLVAVRVESSTPLTLFGQIVET
jgi:tRNA-2-methylthio-N6-dimethylallyladenosine synthase